MGNFSTEATVESFYALHGRDGDAHEALVIRRNPITNLGDEFARRGWRAMTALASLCVRRRDESYAAAFYPFKGPDQEGVVIALAGKGSEGVPADTQFFVTEAIMPLLREYAALDPSRAALDLRDFKQSLIANVLDFAWQDWQHRLYDSHGAVFEGRVQAVREQISGPVDLQNFEAVVHKLQVIRALAMSITESGGDKLPLCYELRELQHVLAKRSMLVLMRKIDNDSSMTGKELEHIMQERNVMVDVTPHLEDTDGQLRSDFSLTAYALNVAAVARQADRLFRMSRWRPDLFREGSPRIVFCPPIRRTVAQACAEPERTADSAAQQAPVSGFLHPPMNLLQHLLGVASPDVQIFPAIGTSSLLCVGCHHCLRVFSTYPGRRRGKLPGKDIAHAGTTGKIVHWISPRFRVRDGSEALRRHMREGMLRAQSDVRPRLCS